jgi:hypothetical protein
MTRRSLGTRTIVRKLEMLGMDDASEAVLAVYDAAGDVIYHLRREPPDNTKAVTEKSNHAIGLLKAALDERSPGHRICHRDRT